MSKVLEINDASNTADIQTESTDVSLFESTLSQHKFAIIKAIDVNVADDGTESISDVANSPTIKAMLIDGDKSIESQWQTPFENSNPEHKLPSLMAGIQSGQILKAVGGVVASSEVADAVSNVVEAIDPITGKLKSTLEGLKGKTNLTKVNTEQVFLSTSSVTLNLTVFFMAISNAREEVEKKIMQLESWVVPKSLSKNGILQNVAASGLAGLFPSEIPPFVSVTISGKTYSPFILTSISQPIVAPIESSGNRLNVSVTLTLMSRTAWDASDVKTLYGVTS